MNETKQVKMWGFERSGTNYIARLLEDNLDVEVKDHDGGWKHGLVGWQQRYPGSYDCHVVVARHPLNNIVSAKRYHGAMGNTFTYQCLLRMWCQFYGYVADVIVDHFPTMEIRWEDAFEDYEAVLDTANGVLAADTKVDEWQNITSRVTPDRQERGSFNRRYYEDEMWRAELPYNIANIVQWHRNRGLDRGWKRFDYEISDNPRR